jgi:hypothetical protein
MAKTPKNHGKEWTKQDVQQLKLLDGSVSSHFGTDCPFARRSDFVR